MYVSQPKDMGFPGGTSSKESPLPIQEMQDLGLFPELGRPPEGGHGNPLPYSCLENPMDRAAWWATVHGGAKRRARLSDFTSLHSLVCPPCSSTHSKSVARRPQEMASNRLERSGVPEWSKDACPFPSLSLDWLVNKTSTSTISSH